MSARITRKRFLFSGSRLALAAGIAGAGANGEPMWRAELDRRVPVLHDERRVYPTLQGNGVTNMTVISQGSVVYNAPLDRYLYTSWTEYTFEFYEAPQPWGPWQLFLHKDFGAYPWFGRPAGPGCSGPKNGGYATTIPSKFISADGERPCGYSLTGSSAWAAAWRTTTSRCGSS